MSSTLAPPSEPDFFQKTFFSYSWFDSGIWVWLLPLPPPWELESFSKNNYLVFQLGGRKKERYPIRKSLRLSGCDPRTPLLFLWKKHIKLKYPQIECRPSFNFLLLEKNTERRDIHAAHFAPPSSYPLQWGGSRPIKIIWAVACWPLSVELKLGFIKIELQNGDVNEAFFHTTQQPIALGSWNLVHTFLMTFCITICFKFLNFLFFWVF